MKKDFINGMFLDLMKQGRVRETLDFCERVAANAPHPEWKSIALRNLSELHFFNTGNGEAARKADEDGLAILDADMNLVFKSKVIPKKFMIRAYSDLCEQIRAIAISLDEYDKYAKKPEAVRSQNATEKRGLMATAQMRQQGVAWKEDMFNRVGDYFAHRAFGQAATILSLVLVHHRELRISGDDMNTHSIPGYASATINIVVGHMNTCLSKGQQIDMYNYDFILENAQHVLKGCEDSRNADPAVISKYVQELERAKEEFASKAAQSGGRPPRPSREDIDAECRKFGV